MCVCVRACACVCVCVNLFFNEVGPSVLPSPSLRSLLLISDTCIIAGEQQQPAPILLQSRAEHRAHRDITMHPGFCYLSITRVVFSHEQVLSHLSTYNQEIRDSRPLLVSSGRMRAEFSISCFCSQPFPLFPPTSSRCTLHVSSKSNCSVIRHKNNPPKKFVHAAGKVEHDICYDAATATLLHQSLSQPGSSQRPPLAV